MVIEYLVLRSMEFVSTILNYGKKIIYIQPSGILSGTVAIMQRNPTEINPSTGVLYTDEEVAQKMFQKE